MAVAQFNEKEIRKTINIMKPNNQLFEIRVICENKHVYSGYFRDADNLIDALEIFRDNSDYNIYMTLNTLNPACYDRSQKNILQYGSKATTSDNDVIGYDWLMIDLDPKRPTGTSSTSDQIQKAKDKGNAVYKFMASVGFEQPLLGFSGNGVHLMYKLHLKNDSDNKKLLEKCLKTLDMLFTDEDIDVDMKNFNPSRVCKLYGTMAQKGASSEERPHRMSKIVSCPDKLMATDSKYLEKLAKVYPQKEPAQQYNNYNPRDFNLEDWLNKYNIGYTKEPFSDGEKYILDECPFDSNHNGKDACIFQSSSGKIGFYCFHNSCSDKTWRDVRMLYEPDAYEKKQMNYEKRIYTNHPPKKLEPVEGKPLFYTAESIFNMPHVDETFIKTGIDELDHRLRGLCKGKISVLSGLRGASKSTILSQMILSAIDNGFNVGCFSGELAPKNFMRWMNQQAAGKAHVAPTQFEGYYNTPKDIQKKIAQWMGKKFVLFNNSYGNNYTQIYKEFEKAIDKYKLDFLVLDNLMAFDISDLDINKYDAQSKFTWSLKKLAEEKNVHILFVAHPRKAMGFLRLDDISGTGDLTNAADNGFIVHRVNEDFKRLTHQMFAWKDDNPIYEATNVIEIAKDRDGGTQDVFVPLFYEKETKRLKNYEAENKIYGWDKDEDGFSPLDEISPFED